MRINTLPYDKTPGNQLDRQNNDRWDIREELLYNTIVLLLYKRRVIVYVIWIVSTANVPSAKSCSVGLQEARGQIYI